MAAKDELINILDKGARDYKEGRISNCEDVSARIDAQLDAVKAARELDEAAFEAGGYVEPWTGPHYRIRDVAEEVRRLGRPLTAEEIKKFEVKEERDEENEKG